MKNTLVDKEKKAIQALKMFEPIDEPYYLCYSGGKDSDCIRVLARLADVKHDIVHNLTTADAPETIHYIKSVSNVIIDKACYSDGSHKTMWNLIPNKLIPPTRLRRYCCAHLKERGGVGRLKITGVRSSESRQRALNGGEIKIIGKEKSFRKYFESNDISYSLTNYGGLVLNFDNAQSRRAVEHCYRSSSTMINPILEWSDSDVWDFLSYYGVSCNPLYQCGFSRVGCLGCPLGGPASMKREFRLYPKFKDNYIRAFDRMLLARAEKNKKTSWSSGEEVFNWWLDLDSDQLTFDGFDLLDC